MYVHSLNLKRRASSLEHFNERFFSGAMIKERVVASGQLLKNQYKKYYIPL
jgi:hypothetical protein